ncbi:CRISPR-associated protein Cas4 [Rhodovulum tesquicola]|uniref:CRISPR-associated protein Cas4 n=1 Tax=Rhodovulum tesquicola TaxID=540254 RepID=UPI0020969086|nr:CRISPR-associated protein Cas4 [Rhodovulum tesquicola]MCO8145197.1 CRISPR-associated protein Cas4 [Rhodovulum tesquicola]
MSLSDADESLPLSALQHWLFCPRQCALIHVERTWSENLFTAEGRILHERADEGSPESRDRIRVLRAVQIASARHRLHGVADVVELRDGVPYPVEYKRGRPKAHRADEVQLCAQGLCLEEMTGHPVPEGALFYGASRRRKIVPLDATLRALTLRVADEVRTAIATGTLPPPVFEARRCGSCSMRDLCRPATRRELGRNWMINRIVRAGVPE